MFRNCNQLDSKCVIEWNTSSFLWLQSLHVLPRVFGVLHDNWEQNCSWPAHRWSALDVKWQTWGRLMWRPTSYGCNIPRYTTWSKTLCSHQPCTHVIIDGPLQCTIIQVCSHWPVTTDLTCSTWYVNGDTMYLRLQLVDGVQGMLLHSIIMHDLVFYPRK